MIKLLRLLGFITFFLPLGMAKAQNVNISGTVSDKSTGEKLAGVTVTVKGKTIGASTNENGRFVLSTSLKLPLTIAITHVGYKPVEQEVTEVSELSIGLEQAPVLGREIVVAASRTPERILESPVSIERMGPAAIKETASPSFYDAIANFKSVESSVQSLTFRSLSTRGFNSNGNIRFNQFVDGMDNQAPGLNFAVGNVIGIPDIDIESVELLPGAASALYGAGGTNGTLLMSSKNPFSYQGVSMTFKSGLNHVDKQQRDRAEYKDLSMRFAKAWSNKLAFKVNLSWMQGEDWQGQDYSNYDRNNGVAKPGDRNTDPLYDGVNVYGDEPNGAYPTLAAVATAVQTQTRAGILAATGGTTDIVASLTSLLPPDASAAQIGGFLGALPASIRPAVQNLIPFYFGLRNNLIPNQSVTRTGYEEKYLVNYGSESIKTSGALHYKITSKIEAIAQANWGKGTSVYTGVDRYSLGDFDIGQYKLELKGDEFFLRGYTTRERSGDSYNSTLLGTYINEYSNPSSAWFPDYTGAFANARNSGLSEEAAHIAARQYADRNRLEANSQQFMGLKNTIITKTIGPAGGAKFNDKSNLYHGEGMYNFTKALNNVIEFQVGSSYRTFNLHSDGTIFDDLSRNISINEFGAYVQAGKKILDDRLKLTGAIRYDKNENFDGRFTPRISGVYSIGENRNLRASFQTGFRNPTTQNQYIDLLVGGSSGVRLIGGLPELISKYDLNSNPGFTLASVNKYKKSGAVTDLQRYTFGEFRPESVKAYEIGYKSLYDNKLLVDASYYYNSYKDFLSSLTLLQPTAVLSSDPLGAPRTISTTVNNPQKVTTQGAALGVDYLYNNFTFTGNATYNKLNDNNSGLNSEFNTPKISVNLGVSSREVVKNIGFNLIYRWQDAYDWSSTFAAGKVPSFGTADAQVSYKIPSHSSVIKIGGSNILNRYYRTSFGNPSVGGIYYVSLVFDQFMR